MISVMCFMLPTFSRGQGYDALWREVEQARERDLPQSALSAVERIAAKAEKKGDWGQLLKAQTVGMELAFSVSPDSLQPRIVRLEKDADRLWNDDKVAAASVADAVLGRVLSERGGDIEAKMTSADHYGRSMSRPQVLGQTSAGKIDPMVVHGIDSKIFGDDLLHIIGTMARRYDAMATYYRESGNRRAECLSRLWAITDASEYARPARRFRVFTATKRCFAGRSGYVAPRRCSEALSLLDALWEYSDLDVYGEVALEAYHRMDNVADAQRYQYADWALAHWSAWPRLSELNNEKARLSQPSAALESLDGSGSQSGLRVRKKTSTTDASDDARSRKAFDAHQFPGMKVNLRNVKGITVRTWLLDVDGDTELNPHDSNDLKKLMRGAKELTELRVRRDYAVKDYERGSKGGSGIAEGEHFVYDNFEDTITVEPSHLEHGVYLIELEADGVKERSRCLHYVSDLTYLAEALPDGNTRIAVVDRKSGQPVAGASVRLRPYNYRRQSHETMTLTTGADGEALAKLKEGRSYRIYLTDNDDRAFREDHLNTSYRYYERGETNHHIEIFTDRRIYRPGQTVKASAVAFFTKRGEETFVASQEKITFRLVDTNGQTVGERELTTDNMGTASVEFAIPESGLSGYYSLRARISGRNTAAQQIRVEEYKRPTFEVEMGEKSDDERRTPQAGDTIEVKGRALGYNGVPVQGGKVAYRVVRRRAYWCWWVIHSEEEQLYSDNTTTDDEGRFSVKMPLVLPEDDSRGFYRFEVQATVTDVAGESHDGSFATTLGRKRAIVISSLKDKELSDSLQTMTLTVMNAIGEKVRTTVKWQIDNGGWHESTSGDDIAIKGLASGKHELTATAEGDTLKRTFIVFGLDDRRPCIETPSWFYASAETFPRDGGNVTVQAGSSDDNVHVLYNIFSGKNIIESGTVELNNELINRKFSYRDEYGDGLLLTFAWVKDGRAYRWKTTIAKPLPDKRLTLKWTTFRDRLEPGQKEQWELQVLCPDGTPHEAHLIATMFDKSLDQLVKHNWSVGLGLWRTLPNTSWQSEQIHRIWMSVNGDAKYTDVKALDFSHLVLPEFFAFRRFRGKPMLGAWRAKGNMAMMSVQSDDMVAEAKMAAPAVMNEAIAEGAIDSVEESTEDSEPETTVTMRENMAETAFFEPGLLTDKEGRAVLRFTLPESVTTWRFIGVAHDAEMRNGLLEGETIAQKELMVEPNVPRFLRRGDKATIMARIANLGDADDEGIATLEMIDPATDKVKYRQKESFKVGQGKTTSVAFSFTQGDEDVSLWVCRVSAKGKSHSDGEQHYLPVLPDKERVTVSSTFTQNHPSTHTVELASLFPDHTSNQRLTIEYTNNPAWLMIQAMPSMGVPSRDNAISLAEALYVNELAQAIMSQSKDAKTVFEQWRRERGDETSLMSALEKNSELKELTLNETPWVVDATNESEQKRQVGLFFEQDEIDRRINSSSNKLRMLQLMDGSWRWWPGMSGSLFLTVDIAEMLVRLQAMTGTATHKDMLDRAFRFMGNKAVERVNEMKRLEKKGVKPSFPGSTALQWLYLCKIDGRSLPQDVAAANQWLIALLKKEKLSQSLYDKALAAIILDSKDYVKSLKEYTVFREDMGRYYDSPRAAYSWKDYRIPTQVAAIEAMKRLTPDDGQTISEMQRWLLQEKRTQAWDTPINSVNAIYAFLYNNMVVLDTKEKTTLALDNTTIESSPTAGTGYVKWSRDYDGAHKFTATKSSEGTSWGTVYAQFDQKTGDIADFDGAGIKVKREIVGDKNNLKVGDKISVLITITTDRDLDFVEVVDKRPACLEPVNQLSGYGYGYYSTPKDCSTNYYFDVLRKGKHEIRTEYYVDRAGEYDSGTITVDCSYAPEFRGTAGGYKLKVKNQ